VICVRGEDLCTLRHSLNIAAKRKATLLRIREFPGSDLLVFLSSLVSLGKCRHCNQIRIWSLPSTSFSLTVLPFDAIHVYSDNRHRPYVSTVWLYSPLLDLGRLFSFFILFTVLRTPWTGDQPVARLLPTHRISQAHTNAHRRPCLE
jgi:hypothetical protein